MIIVNGNRFKSLNDKIYINGKRVIEVYAGNNKVYPTMVMNDYDLNIPGITYILFQGDATFRSYEGVRTFPVLWKYTIVPNYVIGYKVLLSYDGWFSVITSEYFNLKDPIVTYAQGIQNAGYDVENHGALTIYCNFKIINERDHPGHIIDGDIELLDIDAKDLVKRIGQAEVDDMLNKGIYSDYIYKYNNDRYLIGTLELNSVYRFKPSNHIVVPGYIHTYEYGLRGLAVGEHSYETWYNGRHYDMYDNGSYDIQNADIFSTRIGAFNAPDIKDGYDEYGTPYINVINFNFVTARVISASCPIEYIDTPTQLTYPSVFLSDGLEPRRDFNLNKVIDFANEWVDKRYEIDKYHRAEFIDYVQNHYDSPNFVYHP